jgi:effector-binding domain-containing protein
MDYQVSTRELAEQSVVSVRERHSPAELPAFIPGSFGLLYGHLGVLGVAPAGAPFVIYHAIEPDAIDAEVCVPVPWPVSVSDELHSRVLPVMTVARTLHVGPYEELSVAYEALNEWITKNGFVAAGPVQERYLNDPGAVASPADYQTEIEIPIIAAPILVAR